MSRQACRVDVPQRCEVLKVDPTHAIGLVSGDLLGGLLVRSVDESSLRQRLLQLTGSLVTSRGGLLQRVPILRLILADDRGRRDRDLYLGGISPEEIPGVSVLNFLRTALSNRTGTDYTVLELRLKVAEAMGELGMDQGFADRYLNEGFSGGERKRNEVLQMTVLQPELAVLDETDSGLDIDALRTVAEGVSRLHNDERGFLIITHDQRMLDYITPDIVHVFVDGRIAESGGPDLAERIEEAGYDEYRVGAAG